MNLSVFLPKLSGNFYVVDAADGSPWLRFWNEKQGLKEKKCRIQVAPFDSTGNFVNKGIKERLFNDNYFKEFYTTG